MPDLTPIAKMVSFMLAKGARHEEIIEMVSSMETSMDILRGESTEFSVEKDRAYSRQEERKALDRKRKRLSYTAKQSKKTSVEFSSETTNAHIYVEEMDVKSMYVKEKEVKEEATNVEVKEVPLNQVTAEQVPVSRARARKKSGTEIPEIWPTPELLKIGIEFGFSEEEAQNELAEMQDWALSKDERRVSWIAFARKWFRAAKKKQKFTAKPKIQQVSPRLQVILNNERIFREAADRASRNDHNCFETPELRSLGEPTPEIIPKDGNSGYGGIRAGYGPNHGPIPRKSDS